MLNKFIAQAGIFLCFMNLNLAQNQPKAPKKDTILTTHGHQRVDSYFWMNKRDSKEVLDYIAAENSCSENYFKPLQSLQERLMDEFDKRINPNDESAPYFIQGRQFQAKSVAGKDYQETYVLEKGKQVLFFDENERAKGKSYYDLGDWELSTDNQQLAFSEDHTGRRKYSIFFRNEKTKKLLKDQIKDTDGSVIWANDNSTVFYVRKDPQTLREFQVFRHKLGTDSKKDVLVYEEKDEKYAVFISKSLSDKYVFIHSQSTSTNETRMIDAYHPETEAKVFLGRKNGHLYSVYDNNNGFYVLSNENSPNNKVVLYENLPEQNLAPLQVIAHDPKILIEGLVAMKKYLIIQSRANGLQKIEVLDLQTKEKKEISVQEEAYSLNLGLNEEYEADQLFYSYNSMTTPTTVYKYRIPEHKAEEFFSKKLIDPKFSPENYESKRVWATANDGTQIPISMVYRKGLDLSKAPLLLYGYGSYGITIPAEFNAMRISLLDRGFVFAIAHIRGGKYLGESWYENGKFLKKKNTFTDFINAAEYLGMKSYCDKNKIYAQGGSAGGLLMGAVLNMAPYMWKGVIAQVPFVDVVTTMLDESIPLTVGEYEEWGNPNEENYYWYMLNYSPYDNVKKMDYPSLLITTGYHDSQVQYWEPLKWIAKIREYRTNDKPLLLDCNMDAGHGGGSGRTSERRETAKKYSFILNLEGIEN